MTVRRVLAQDAITAIPGVRVGHSQREGDGWLTGVTTLLFPPDTLSAVDVRGPAPGTHEIDALSIGAVSPFPSAIVLTGGSAFGLASISGVVQWCQENGRGYRVGTAPGDVVPIVPGAAIFDLGRGGDFTAVPSPQMGYEAAEKAGASFDYAPVEVGHVGAGTGATIANETYRGGIGTFAATLEWEGDTGTIAALAVVNAYGRVTTSPPAAPARRYTISNLTVPQGNIRLGGDIAGLNTTLVVLATDIRLDHGQLQRLAGCGHTGMARSIAPVHTLADGDTVFACSTGKVELSGFDPLGPLGRIGPMRDSLIAVHSLAATVTSAAITNAVSEPLQS